MNIKLSSEILRQAKATATNIASCLSVSVFRCLLSQRSPFLFQHIVSQNKDYHYQASLQLSMTMWLNSGQWQWKCHLGVLGRLLKGEAISLFCPTLNVFLQSSIRWWNRFLELLPWTQKGPLVCVHSSQNKIHAGVCSKENKGLFKELAPSPETQVS